MIYFRLFLILFLCSALSFSAFAQTAPTPEVKPAEEARVKLYRLDCGTINVSDLNVFSDTDQYVGEQKQLASSCYLIRYDDKVVLWDTGLPNSIAEKPEGVVNGVFGLRVQNTLASQLDVLGLQPSDVTHVALSHLHFDHAGNTNMFENAQLIIQKAELDFVKNNPKLAQKYFMDPALISHFLESKKEDKIKAIEGDVDLFGDGILKTIFLPGHTPGHMALLINLEESGPLILAGDQWHFTENHAHNGVPSFNYDRADTLASSDKLDKLRENHNAIMIIQHEPNDNSSFPALPDFMK